MWEKLIPLALGAGGAYFGYKAQQNTKKNSDRAYAAYEAARAARLAQSGSGGGGGGGGRGNGAAMSALMGNIDRTNQQYALAMELLKPYVDAGAAIIPKQQDAYLKQMDNFNNMASSFLSPAAVEQILTRKPSQSYERPLPSYLAGGSGAK